MGFSKERGDSISVANSPFNTSEKADNSPPIWKDPETIAFGKDILKYLIIAAIVAFLYLKIIQPSLKTMFPPPPKPEELTSPESIVDAAGNVIITGDGEDEEGEDEVHINHYAVKLQKARDIAQSDPKSVSNMLKDWMGANGG
jgi:flagellar M-ring protein FliF